MGLLPAVATTLPRLWVRSKPSPADTPTTYERCIWHDPAAMRAAFEAALAEGAVARDLRA